MSSGFRTKRLVSIGIILFLICLILITLFVDNSKENIGNNTTGGFDEDVLEIRQLDTVPPICSKKEIEPGPQESAEYIIHDNGGGLDSIYIIDSNNAIVSIPKFRIGVKDPIIVKVEKKDLSEKAVIIIEVLDISGNKIKCTPIDF